MHERIIQAAIVNHERNKVIVGQDGLLPQMKFESEHKNLEGTLDLLGKTALANIAYVSVDHRLVGDDRTTYQTKPVPVEAVPVEPFRWGECPDTVILK